MSKLHCQTKSMKCLLLKTICICILLFWCNTWLTAQQQKNHTQVLFDEHIFEHLEAEYLWKHMNAFSFYDYQWTQPTQLSLSHQKTYTYYKVAELNNQKSSATFDLKKIANAQSDFYFSELSSYHLANYYFSQKQFGLALSYIKMTTPFATNNEEWKSLSLKKAYCLYKNQQYISSYKLFSQLANFSNQASRPYAQFYQGYLAYLLGDYQTSTRVLRSVDNIAPFDAIAPLITLQSFFKEQKYDSLLAYAEQIDYPSEEVDSLNLKASHKLLAYTAFLQQKYALSIQHYQKLSIGTSKNKNNLGLLYQYGYALYKERKLEKARTILEHVFVLSRSSEKLNSETAFVLAAVYLAKGRKEKARTVYANVRKGMSTKDKQDLASFLYAKLGLDLGYINDATTVLKELEKDESHPKRKEIIDYLVQALAISKDYKASYELLSKIKDPSHNLLKLLPLIYFQYGQLLIKTNNYTDADKLLTAVENNVYTSKELLTEVYFWKIEIAIGRVSYAKALQYAELYQEVANAKIDKIKLKKFAYNFGYLYFKAFKYKEAIPLFKKVTASLKPNRPKIDDWKLDAFLYQADCELMLKNYTRAYNKYNAIIKYGSRYADYAYYQNCQIIGFQDVREKEKRIDAFEELYPQSPYLYKALMDKVYLMMNDKRYEQSVRLLESMLSHRTNAYGGVEQTDILLRLALAHYNTNNYKKADSLYKEVIINYPNTEAGKEAIRSLKIISVEQANTDSFYELLGVLNIDVDEQEKDSLDFSVVKNNILSEANEEQVKKSINDYLYKHTNGQYVAQSYFILANQASQKGKWKSAQSYYQQVLMQPKNEYTEEALVAISKITYFELKDFSLAKKYFIQIADSSKNATHVKDALRGLLRIYYIEKDWGRGYRVAKRLETFPISASDDNDLKYIIYGKNLQMEKKYIDAIQEYSNIIQRSYYYPEVQYEIARSYLKMDSTQKAKEVALAITKLNTPNTFFYSKCYLLLGDIFLKEKDYFNAKATLGSLAQYANDSTVKQAARNKLQEIGVLEEIAETVYENNN